MIVGIDEVGRGCLAGPLVAGAVLLDRSIPGLRDSKKLTKLQREKFDLIIRKKAVAFGLGWATVEEVDQAGLTQAVRWAMERALNELSATYDGMMIDEIIIDGNYNFLATTPLARCVIKADDSVPAVSAASIIAKVARDAFMKNAAAAYPGYHFDRHVGYSTQAHLLALQDKGICALHRRSFAPVRAALTVLPDTA